MRPLQWVLWTVGLTLQGMVLGALLRGPFREFRVLFVYVFVLVGTTIGDIAAFYAIDRNTTFYPIYYWSAELLRQTSLFAVVVSLVSDLVAKKRGRYPALYVTMAGAAVFWTANLAFTWGPDLNPWMTSFVRNLSFATAVLNLGVWFSLISTRIKDNRRLLIAGALGLQMTGEAIGQSLRHLFPQWNTALASFLLLVSAHFFCLAIWWYALAREPEGNAAVAASAASAAKL